LLAQVLLSWHNIAYYQALVRRMRHAMDSSQFDAFAAGFRAGLADPRFLSLQ
jgi:queuine tRNA-ribosyltransferase